MIVCKMFVLRLWSVMAQLAAFKVVRRGWKRARIMAKHKQECEQDLVLRPVNRI